jgi:hypothetical protein
MICYKPSFPPPDQVGGDVKDMVYQLPESFIPSFPTPDQVEGDIKDTIYQTTGIAHIVIPDPRSGRG